MPNEKYSSDFEDNAVRAQLTAAALCQILGLLEETAAKGTPWCSSDAFGLAHVDDVPLEVMAGDAPKALVHAKLGKGMTSGVLVDFADDPCKW